MRIWVTCPLVLCNQFSGFNVMIFSREECKCRVVLYVVLYFMITGRFIQLVCEKPCCILVNSLVGMEPL